MTILVNTEIACVDLVRHLFSPKRKYPAVVITQRADKTGPVVKGFQLQEHLGPMARVYLLSGSMKKQFNRMLDNVFGIEPTGVRFYVPRMTMNDTPSRHPVWNEWKIADYDSPELFMDEIKNVCLKRIEFQKSHSHTSSLLTPEQADELLKQAAPSLKASEPPQSRHQRLGRKLLSVKPPPRPAPSEEALIALQQRFAH